MIWEIAGYKVAAKVFVFVQYYEQVIKTPAAMPADVTFSPLLRVAKKAYERKTGKKMIIAPAFNYETYSNQGGWD